MGKAAAGIGFEVTARRQFSPSGPMMQIIRVRLGKVGPRLRYRVLMARRPLIGGQSAFLTYQVTRRASPLSICPDKTAIRVEGSGIHISQTPLGVVT